MLLDLATALDPALLFTRAGLTPDGWQQDLLRGDHARTLLLCSRQVGKSATAAALALRAALFDPPSLVLLLSPTLRQSGELFRDKVLTLYNAIGRPEPARQETQLTLALTNGSRIISLPGEERTVRGFSGVSLLVIDEAARVEDSLYAGVRPMLAVSGGSLVALSSAYARAGWFYSSWVGDEDWHRVRVTADQCPRIPKSFLEEERRALGARLYAMEYLCQFAEAIDSVFDADDVEAIKSPAVPPLTL